MWWNRFVNEWEERWEIKEDFSLHGWIDERGEKERDFGWVSYKISIWLVQCGNRREFYPTKYRYEVY